MGICVYIMYLLGFAVFVVAHTYLSSQFTYTTQDKSMQLYTPHDKSIQLYNTYESDNTLITVGKAFVELHKVKAQYLDDGFNAIVSISSSSSISDIIWNKFDDFIKLFKSLLIIMLIKYIII
jgi:hypothetical protein